MKKSKTVQDVLNRLRNPNILDCYAFEPGKVYMINLDPTTIEEDALATIATHIQDEFRKHGIGIVCTYLKPNEIQVMPISKSEQRRLAIQKGE